MKTTDAVAALSARAPSRAASVAGWGFLVGTVLFSGSLYALAVTGVRKLGMITPLGGVAFLAGLARLGGRRSAVGRQRRYGSGSEQRVRRELRNDLHNRGIRCLDRRFDR